MPTKAEYAKLKERAPGSFPARFHAALARLMGGAAEVVVGETAYGSLERQRLEFRLFLGAWSPTSPHGAWIARHLVRTKQTREPRGAVLWATARPVFTAGAK